jgi:hypothetical protein
LAGAKIANRVQPFRLYCDLNLKKFFAAIGSETWALPLIV